MPDARRPDLEQLDWSAEQRAASLSKVYEHAVAIANSAERWYAAARASYRKFARWVRVAAIVLGGVAAVLPILAEVYTTDGRPAIAPGWAAIAIVAAATLIALDRFFGFSSAWMRFMAAELSIARLRHEFEYAWESARARAATPIGQDDAVTLLSQARDFVLAIDDAVSAETSGWITDFRTTLAQAEQDLRRSHQG